MPSKLTLEYCPTSPDSHYCLLVVMLANLSNNIKLKPIDKQIFKRGRGWQPPKLFEGKKLLKLSASEIALYFLKDKGPAESLYPLKLKQHVDLWLEVIHSHVAEPIIAAASTDDQASYQQHYRKFFDKLDEINHQLSCHEYLCGDSITLADLALFAELIRFDMVYYFLFLLNWKRIIDYPHIWSYLRRIYQKNGISDTIDFDQVRIDYFSLKAFNPSLIVPKGPALDFMLPPKVDVN